MKWDIPRFDYRPKLWFNVVRHTERYDFTQDRYVFASSETIFSTRSKSEASRCLEMLEKKAKKRIAAFSERNGEYAFRTSTDDLRVAMYGNKYHFTIS